MPTVHSAASLLTFATALLDAAGMEHDKSVVIAEVLVTVRRDAPVGWVVSLGFGGVMTELWTDVTHLLAPVSHDDVVAAALAPAEPAAAAAAPAGERPELPAPPVQPVPPVPTPGDGVEGQPAPRQPFPPTAYPPAPQG